MFLYNQSMKCLFSYNQENKSSRDYYYTLRPTLRKNFTSKCQMNARVDSKTKHKKTLLFYAKCQQNVNGDNKLSRPIFRKDFTLQNPWTPRWLRKQNPWTPRWLRKQTPTLLRRNNLAFVFLSNLCHFLHCCWCLASPPSDLHQPFTQQWVNSSGVLWRTPMLITKMASVWGKHRVGWAVGCICV